MRLARYVIDGAVQTGRIDGDHVVSLGVALTLEQLIRGGLSQLLAAAAESEGDRHAISEVGFLAPIVADARCLFATGWNYRSHFAEGADIRDSEVSEPEYPTFFSKPLTTVIGPHDPILIDDHLSQQYDYEAELAVVIGRRGRDISSDEAMSYVFGYVAANDVTARDIQRRHGGQWLKGKAIDGTCPLGPWIVTADELQDPQSLTIECLLNGEVRQRAETGTMAFPIPRLIQELSAGMTILPGDILLTGTPAGVGWARQPPTYLVDGDELVTRISHIGELRNRVQAVGAARHAQPKPVATRSR